MHVRSLLAAACLAALVACSPTPEVNPTASAPGAAAASTGTSGQHDAAIDALFADQVKPGNPGAAVGVYHQGKLVFAKGYGLADVEAGTPITPQTQFHVASVSKQFAAFSVALLAREGKVDLDADVRTYLPYLPDFGHTITVRHLILHTSGLRDQWSLFEIGGHGLDDRLRQAQVVNMIERQRGLNFTPGSKHMYSNTGYTLLAEIVHAVSGQTLRAFSTERIFQPLGMDRTFFFDDVTEIVPGRANSYQRGDEEEEDGDAKQPLKRSLLSYDNAGATSLFTTVEDMAKWAANFTDPKVGDRALIDQVSTNGTLDDGTPIEYGFALVRKQMGGRTVVTHSGADAGFRAIFVYYPEHDFAVTLSANIPFDLESKVNAIADLYLPKVEQATSTDDVPAPVDPDADLTPLAGVFLHPEQNTLRLIQDGTQVYRLNWQGKRENVVMRQDGSFDFGEPARQRFTPVRDGDGRVTALEARSPRQPQPVTFARVQPSELDATGLTPYAGRYRSQELDITYAIEVKGDQLAMSSLWTAKPVELKQVVADRFDSDAWWSGVVLFQRDAAGRIRSLSLNGGRASGIVLERVE